MRIPINLFIDDFCSIDNSDKIDLDELMNDPYSNDYLLAISKSEV